MVEIELGKLLETPDHFLAASQFINDMRTLRKDYLDITMKITHQTNHWLSKKMTRKINQLFASDDQRDIKIAKELWYKSCWYDAKSAHATNVSVEFIGCNWVQMEEFVNKTLTIANALKAIYEEPKIELYNDDIDSPYCTNFEIDFV